MQIIPLYRHIYQFYFIFYQKMVYSPVALRKPEATPLIILRKVRVIFHLYIAFLSATAFFGWFILVYLFQIIQTIFMPVIQVYPEEAPD